MNEYIILRWYIIIVSAMAHSRCSVSITVLPSKKPNDYTFKKEFADTWGHRHRDICKPS